MTTVENIRNKAGLTQQEMADYLGVSRAVFRKVEIGGYSLNVPSLQRLVRISQCADKARCYARVAQKQVIDEEGYKLRLHTRLQEIETLQIQLKLAEMVNERNKNIFQLITDLKAQEKEEDMLWIELMHYKIVKKLRARGRSIDMLQEKIYLLTAEAGYISQYLEKGRSILGRT